MAEPTAPPPVDGAVWIYVMEGQFALVDESDAPRVREFNWRVSGRGYAAAYVNGKSIMLHRFLFGLAAAGRGARSRTEVDHINGDCLDNRRSNLRLCTRQQNAGNMRKRGASGFKGVIYLGDHARSRPWRAQIGMNGRAHVLGYFFTGEEAASVYDRAARAHFGEFARCNFSEQWSG